MTIGQRIRHLRLARDLSQQDLAVAAGLNRSSIANIERDHQQPTIQGLIGIAARLGVSIGVLAGTEPMPHMPYVAIEILHAVSCSECGDLGAYRELEQAKKVRREHRCPLGGDQA